MKNIVILYHNNCADGFGGAWAAWKKFGFSAKYIGINHQEPPPKGLKGSDLYLIDFSYPLEITKKLLKSVKSLTIIDHHISAAKTVELAAVKLYDNSHSGAVLAWKFFHPNKKIPRLLLHIEDIDIWKFKQPFTKELIAYLDSYELDFKLWNKFAIDWDKPFLVKKYIEQGQAIVRYQEQIIKEIAAYAEKVNFQGYKTLAVNSPILRSELGHFLYNKKPPISIIWYKINRHIAVSLRSNGTIDVSKLAVKFGGGGHKAAAGFSWLSEKSLPWTKIK
ncbi:MAG: hypothetical protein HYW34_02975 [Candidatus Brennerbacteria bacterium]|nr:hypothetical protein [Candidatus Brennerbacteria bacterium]